MSFFASTGHLLMHRCGRIMYYVVEFKIIILTLNKFSFLNLIKFDYHWREIMLQKLNVVDDLCKSTLSWLLAIPLFHPFLANMLLLSQNCLNANPNLILGSLLLSEPSDQLFVVLKSENFWKRTHSALHRSSFKSLRNQYHRLILTFKKKQYFSNFVSLVSDNPKRLWKTVNNLLYRKIFFTITYLYLRLFSRWQLR